MPTAIRPRRIALPLVLALIGGGGACGSAGRASSAPAARTYQVRVTVSGLLGAALVLHSSLGDDLTVFASGVLSFPSAAAAGTPYAVTLAAQPTSPWQTCTFSSAASGTLGETDVPIAVVCSTNRYRLIVRAVGVLLPALSLQNGADTLTLDADGVATFFTSIASGHPYSVTATGVPPTQRCTVTGGSGTIAGEDAEASVSCTCAASLADCDHDAANGCETNVSGTGGACPPPCADGRKDRNETDVDCGGSCTGCSDGKTCDIHQDCISGTCDGGTHTCEAIHRISGTVTGATGVTILLGDAAMAATTTDTSGRYAFTGLAAGRYTVTPSLGGEMFTPASRTITVKGADVTGQDFAITTDPTGTVAEFLVSTRATQPTAITAGPDGNVWVAESRTRNIARVTPSGTVTEFTLPFSSLSDNMTDGITTGPDGNLWVLEKAAFQVWRVSPTGSITEMLGPYGNNHAITTGPDGNLWMTVSSGGDGWIARITTAGVGTKFALPTWGATPYGIAPGQDGNIWFTERSANLIGRITPDGAITEFTIPTRNSEPIAIAQGSDGNLWFTEGAANKIGRITPTGDITEFAIPTSNSWPCGIASGPDGNLWFTEYAGKIGRITPTGVITEFAIPTADALPLAITAGPDGRLWFTEFGANKVACITP